MRIEFTCVLCIAVVCGAFHSQAQEYRGTAEQVEGLREHPVGYFAITNAKVVTAPDQPPSVATLIIKGSQIVAVGKDVEIPAGATEIDLAEHYIYPGFIDSYAEVDVDTADSGRRLSYWNEKIKCDFAVSSAATLTQLKADESRKQGFVARLIAPREGILRGRAAIYSLGNNDAQQNLLRDAVALTGELTLPRRGSRKTYPNSPMGAVALARQAFYDAIWYRDAQRALLLDPMLIAPEENRTLQAMEPVLAGNMSLMIETSNEQFFLRANRFAREFDLDLIVIGSGREYRLLPQISETKRTVIVPVNFPKAPHVATPEAASSVTLQALMHWDHAPENLARLAEQDVEILLTTHSLDSMGDFLKNLRLAVNRGLSENAALAALTTVPAKRFRVDDRLGSLAPGKLASFVVSSQPLFDDEAKVVETWVNGDRFQHDKEQDHDLAATWKVEISDAPGNAVSSFRLKIEGTGSLKGKVIVPSEEETSKETTIDLKEFKLENNRLTGRFFADEFGLKGVATLSIVLEEDAEAYLGVLRWPNATVSPFSMSRMAESPKTNEEEDDQDSSPKADTEAKSDDKEEQDSDEERRDQPASFPVQFPLGAFGRESLPEDPGIVAFTNAVIWTASETGMIEAGTVVIKAGRIRAIGKDVSIPAAATVIDLSGKHLTPGLIDCHSHIASDGGINESGQAITAEVRIGDFVDANDIDIYWQLAGGLTTANILHGSANPIGGQNQVIKMRWGADFETLRFNEAPPGIKFALGENVKQSNWGDDYTTRYPQTRMGVEQIFRDEFLEAREYAAAHAEFARTRRGLPPRVDLELEAIAEILAGERWIHCHSYRQDEILALIRVLDEFEIRIGSFQHILEGYKVADAMRRHGATGSSFSDWWAYKVEVKDSIPYNGAIMHEQGIVVSFNSDDAELGRRMNHEAAKAVKYGGVSPEEALKFVTLNPAIQLRIDEYVGSLEVGKHADLAIWSGPPLSNFSICEQTWVDGLKYFDRGEELQRRKQFAEMKNVLIQKILDTRAPMMPEGESMEDPTALWPRHDEFCHTHDEHEHFE